jgi:hypothetical protein
MRRGGNEDREHGLTVSGGLDAVELRILAALGHQLIVRADLYESGPIEGNDEIGHTHRRETVEDENGDAAGAARRFRVALEQRVFSLSI